MNQLNRQKLYFRYNKDLSSQRILGRVIGIGGEKHGSRSPLLPEAMLFIHSTRFKRPCGAFLI